MCVCENNGYGWISVFYSSVIVLFNFFTAVKFYTMQLFRMMISDIKYEFPVILYKVAVRVVI